MSGKLAWSEERGSWPLAEFSEFHEVDGLRWHVQRAGEGPTLLLLHGTGASTHSWRHLLPRLARRFTVIAPDLPEHGFTRSDARPQLSLPAMADAVGRLIDRLGVQPEIAIGHSAGAAIALRATLDGRIRPTALIGINAALLPFRGAAGVVFPSLAKLMFLNPWTPRLLASSARSRERVVRLIDGTGSKLDAEGIDLYARLFGNAHHVTATLGMMAHWDLHRFKNDLAGLHTPLLLLVGEKDRTVPVSEAARVLDLVPAARVLRLPGLGHLAHEEDADAVATAIFEHLASKVLQGGADDESGASR